jgi:hypothetical protein
MASRVGRLLAASMRDAARPSSPRDMRPRHMLALTTDGALCGAPVGPFGVLGSAGVVSCVDCLLAHVEATKRRAS